MKKLTTLCTLLLIFSMCSCASFKRCQQKFGSTVTDSVRIQVPVSVIVPRDSVVTSFLTDTTYLYKEIQQGRAKVIVERTNTVTTVQAKCDTVTVTKLVPVKVPGPRVVWGVAPWYKNAFKYSLCANALLIVIIIILLDLLNKRTHDLPPSNDQLSRSARR